MHFEPLTLLFTYVCYPTDGSPRFLLDLPAFDLEEAHAACSQDHARTDENGTYHIVDCCGLSDATKQEIKRRKKLERELEELDQSRPITSHGDPKMTIWATPGDELQFTDEDDDEDGERPQYHDWRISHPPVGRRWRDGWPH